MAVKTRPRLPPPPTDLLSRTLPLTRVSGRLYRIHPASHPPIFFGRGRASRFDDPLKRYGVAYAALNPEAAFAEVFLRQLDQMLLEESALESRALSIIQVEAIYCVDLTGEGLRRLSCDNRIATEMPYRTIQLWSRAFFEHPNKPAGILYRSRHNPKLKCLAIFSTFSKRLKLQTTQRLLRAPLRKWTIKQIDRHRLGLLPSQS